MWRHYNCAVYVRRRPTGSKLATIIIYVSQGKGVKMATRCCATRSLPRKTKGGRTRGKGCVIYADETSAELESSFARKAKGSYPPFNFLRYRDLFRTKTRKYNLSFVLIVETDRFSNRWKELLRRVISPGNALARGRKTGCKYQESGLFVSITRRAAGVRFSTNFQHRG